MADIVRYLVIKVEIEVDLSECDQKIEDVEDEILDIVASELKYNVSFDAMVEAGDDSTNAIEVPVRIIDTEVQGMLKNNPI